MPNRNKIKQYFLTYPQSGDETKQSFANTLQLLPTLIYYRVSKELHKDGNPHLHAVIKLDPGITKSNILKFFQEKYPESYKRIDVESTRSMSHALEYIVKDGDYIENVPYSTIDPNIEKCKKARKVKFYTAQLNYINQLTSGNFRSGLEIYNYILENENFEEISQNIVKL